MTKLVTNIFSFLLWIFFFYQNIAQVNTLRCAHDCRIDPTPFGSLDPIKTPCKTIDVDNTTTICAVFLFINFEIAHIYGALNEKLRLVNQSSILHLSTIFYHSEIRTYINYQCATTDYCDEEFVRETISSSKWFQLNETKVRTDISSLLFQTDFIIDRIVCDNNLVCSRFKQCVAELIQNNSVSHVHQMDFNNNFPCDDMDDSQVQYDQHFHAPDAYEDMKMKVYCNKQDCNRRQIIDEVYNIIRTDFILPLNYSAYIPISNGLARTNDFISIALFLFLYFFLT